MIGDPVSIRMYNLKKTRWAIGFRDFLALFKSCILPFLIKDVFSTMQLVVQSYIVYKSYKFFVLESFVIKKDWIGFMSAHRSSNLLTVICSYQTIYRTMRLEVSAHQEKSD